MLKVGDAVGTYVLQERCPAGGFCEVFRATDAGGSTVAIKVLADAQKTDALKDRLRREFSIQANIDHPNVVRVRELIPDVDGGPAIVMDFVSDALPLHEAAAAVALDLEEIASLFLEALYGLAKIHESEPDIPIVHRDLSSNNLLVGDHGLGTLQISDFGFAKAAGAISIPGSSGTFGTPGFVAPEQYSDFANVDIRADIFTVGRSFLAALGQNHPDYVDPATIPEPFQSLIQRMTRAQREDRPQTPSAALEEAILAFGASGIVPPDRTLRRHAKQFAVGTAPNAWRNVLAAFFAQRSPAVQMEFAFRTDNKPEFAQVIDADAFLDAMEQGPVETEFGHGGAIFERCDHVAALYRSLYPHLDPAHKLIAARRLLETAADYNRYSCMYAFRTVYGNEAAPAVKEQIKQLRDSIPKYSVVRLA